MKPWIPTMLAAGGVALAATALQPATDAGAAAVRAVTHAAPALAPTSSERALATRKCREKSFEDPAEFRFDYGSGPGAMNRCIARKVRKARFECRQKATEEPFEFREDYGTGAAAQRRCVRDELD